MKSPFRPLTALLLLAFVVMPIGMTGCVQQDQYDALLESYRSLQEQVAQLKDERDGYRSSVDGARAQSSRYSTELGSLQTQYTSLQGDFDSLSSETDDYLNRISSLEIGPLPIDLARALDELASRHPGLVEFDARLGMLRFSSDFTFDLGSSELQANAQTTIRTVADIMNSAAAAGIDGRVVGHTDNVPIRKEETRRRYPTNLHLSVGRAISVRDALVAAGVAPHRLEVAGWGEFQPVTSNGIRGSEMNRRVELYFVPSAPNSLAIQATPETMLDLPTEPASAPTGDIPMK